MLSIVFSIFIRKDAPNEPQPVRQIGHGCQNIRYPMNLVCDLAHFDRSRTPCQQVSRQPRADAAGIPAARKLQLHRDEY